MATRLDNLKLVELSFVDKGANQHAAVTIFKRADCDEDEEKVKRKKLDRLTALKAKIDILGADLSKIEAPQRLEALKARVADLTQRASAVI